MSLIVLLCRGEVRERVAGGFPSLPLCQRPQHATSTSLVRNRGPLPKLSAVTGCGCHSSNRFSTASPAKHRRVQRIYQTNMTDTSFYESSANVLAQCNGARENLDALLDPENGFAPRLSRMCKQK